MILRRTLSTFGTCSVIAAIALFPARKAVSKTIELKLTRAGVQTLTSERDSTAVSYVARFEIPDILKRATITSAILEFSVTTSTASSLDSEGGVLLEVFPLLEPVTDGVAPTVERTCATKNIRSGTSQRVVVDVTTALQAWTHLGRTNNGFLIRISADGEAGSLRVRHSDLAPGLVARLRVHVR
jgi:hypothetical protein